MSLRVLSQGQLHLRPPPPGGEVEAPAPSSAHPSSPSQYVIKTVEVESSKTKQALSESQARNQHLQEQVAMQRQVLKEMEQQLQSSHQLTAQLRAQVCRLPGRTHRAVGEYAHAAGKPEVGLQHSMAVQYWGAHGAGFQPPHPALPAGCVTSAKFYLRLCFLVHKMMCS